MIEDHDPALGDFRARLRAWLAVEGPRHGWDRGAPVNEPGDLRVARARECQRLLLAAGFAGITWPVEFGGQGLGTREQIVFDQETGHYQLPMTPLVITLGICGPTLLAIGTAEQKDRYLAPLLRADEMWCQLFSEPGAGSDIAGLSTRAVRDGDGWRITGQKVWTSGATNCAFGLVLTRSDPRVPKHRGLTMFVVDMHSPGIEIRPLRQMNNEARFNEVFFDDVHVPAANVVGDVDAGWRAATATLMTERVSIGSGTAGRDAHEAATLIDAARRAGVDRQPMVRAALVRAVERERIADLMGARIAATVLAGRRLGPEGSVLKLAGTARSQQAAMLGVDLHGAAAIAWDPADSDAANWSQVFLSAPGLSIAGGTTEVQKNILGERILGLPREP
ncbi:MAG TPA: acyl-CoA dehydrogenase family protein, partial [Ilumatobacteraceae bacterium]